MVPLFLAACNQAPPPAKPNVRSVKTVVVETQAGDQVRQFPGHVAASKRAVLSFPLAGTISKIAFKAGDRVKAGQVIASIDPRPLELEVEGAVADLRKAESALDQRNNTLKLNRELVGKGFIGDAGLEQSEADVKAAQSDVSYRKSRLEKARLSLRDSRIEAPFAGVIGERYVEPNEEVSPGKPVVSLLGEDQFEIQVSVPEVAISRISVGMSAEVTLSALAGTKFRGKVRDVSRVAGAGNVYPVTVALENPPPNLRAGMTANVALNAKGPARESTGLLLPVGALKPGEQSGQGHVFVFDPDSSTARMKPVRILSVRDNDVVVEGIEGGSRVIVAGVSFLSDGQAVRLMAQDKP